MTEEYPRISPHIVRFEDDTYHLPSIHIIEYDIVDWSKVWIDLTHLLYDYWRDSCRTDARFRSRQIREAYLEEQDNLYGTNYSCQHIVVQELIPEEESD